MAENVGGIVAIELMAAAQGLDLLAPLATSPKLGQGARRRCDEIVPPLHHDRTMAPTSPRRMRFVHAILSSTSSAAFWTARSTRK